MTRTLASTVPISLIFIGVALFANSAIASDRRNSGTSAWLNLQTLYPLERKASDGWRSTITGLRYRRVNGGGVGARPTSMDTITIHYVGRYTDGTEFDSSIARGQPAVFPLNRLIKGWQEGVLLMSTGDTYEFVIRQDLAYGPKGKGAIPGGATLLFSVELLGVTSVRVR
jgi:FKBP-type peptidyl-prolyl cis-trans isomerase FkpA